MTKEETTATWQSWLLDAIHKIRYQKQRPNVERIAACVRMHHPQVRALNCSTTSV